MPPSKAHRAEIAGRRAQLIKLRRAGLSFEHPQILALGYGSRQAASKDMIRALEERRDEQAAEASIYRQEENERLDDLLAAVWPHAIGTHQDPDGAVAFDPKAIETVLKLMDRRAKLNGYDMPVRAEVSGPDGGAIPLGSGTLAELNSLIGIAGGTGIVLPGDDDIEDVSPAAVDGDDDSGG